MKYLITLVYMIGTLMLGHAQTIDVVKFDELEQRWSGQNDTIYIVNYWATWCAPCVKELPDFLNLDREMQGKPFKMLLVSLDFPSQANKRVLSFVKKRNITTEVVVLDDDPNIWINKVDKNWDGDIPVTQVIKSDKIVFYGGEMTYNDLKEAISKIN